MKRFELLAASLSLATLTTAATSRICPILGQQYPSPTGLRNESIFLNTTHALKARLDSAVHSAPYNATTFSIGMFSTSCEDILWEYHHTTPVVANVSIGARHADANSIYRVGSISKLITVYLFLIKLGDSHFGDSITQYIPELKGVNGGANMSSVPDWDNISVGELASQLGGIARDYGLGDLAVSPLADSLIALGFPQLTPAQLPSCGYTTQNGSFVACTVEGIVSGVDHQKPAFPSSYTPVYSNNGFALLGLALENGVNATYQEILERDLVNALHLRNTAVAPPHNSSNGIIPGGPLLSGWSTNLGLGNPAGGVYSSTNDLATIGRAILSSALLSKAETRRWLKPHSFVEDLAQGVGAPWEIFRLRIDGRTVDLYTKAGDIGNYHSVIALVPDYDFGFSVLSATDIAGDSSDAAGNVVNLIGQLVLPAVERVAKQQAARRFAGRYTDTSSNSSITVSTDSQPGLTLSSWVINGTEIFDTLRETYGGADVRLYPNHLFEGSTIGFTGSFRLAQPELPANAFYWQCPTWAGVGSPAYGTVGVGDVNFEVDASGRTIALRSLALRKTLRRG